MTTEQMAADDKAVLAAWLASGLDSRKLVVWVDVLSNGRRHNYRLAHTCGRWFREMQWDQEGEWAPDHHGDYYPHEAASLILRHMQAELDEAGVGVGKHSGMRPDIAEGHWWYASGPHCPRIDTISRGLATVAAYIALKEQGK